MGLTLTSAPAVEPVTLKQLKEHLRIYDTEDHDVELTALIKEARQFIENLSLIHISDPTRPPSTSRMPSSS